jgi:hypothetical protein
VIYVASLFCVEQPNFVNPTIPVKKIHEHEDSGD